MLYFITPTEQQISLLYEHFLTYSLPGCRGRVVSHKENAD